MHRSPIFVTWILLWAVLALAGCQLESGRDVGVPATAAQPSDLNFVEGKESFDNENWEDAVVEFSEVLKTIIPATRWPSTIEGARTLACSANLTLFEIWPKLWN